MDANCGRNVIATIAGIFLILTESLLHLFQDHREDLHEERTSMEKIKEYICAALRKDNSEYRPFGAHFRRNVALWALNAKKILADYKAWHVAMGINYEADPRVQSPAMLKTIQRARELEVWYLRGSAKISTVCGTSMFGVKNGDVIWNTSFLRCIE